MTTKGLSRKQIIISISDRKKSKFMAPSSAYITNLNRTLKNIKSDIMANFVQANQHNIIITTNKVTLLLDLQNIENYIKNIDNIDLNNILTSQLPQSKFYLKIISIPHLMENTNMFINSSVVETILKNNISLVLKP